MSCMHKSDHRLPTDQQDKRSVITIEMQDVTSGWRGAIWEAAQLLRLATVRVFEAGPTSGTLLS